jgi:hypothetical protein
LVLRDSGRPWWIASRATAPHENDERGRRWQEHNHEDHQDREANDTGLRRLVGRRVKNHQCEQEGEKHYEGWAEPTVTPPALEHLTQPNHGSAW